RRGAADWCRLSGDRRASTRGRPLRKHSAAGWLRDLRVVAPAHRWPRCCNSCDPCGVAIANIDDGVRGAKGRYLGRLRDCRRGHVLTVGSPTARLYCQLPVATDSDWLSLRDIADLADQPDRSADHRAPGSQRITSTADRAQRQLTQIHVPTLVFG